MAKARTVQHTVGLKLVFHGAGISCLAGAVLLELLVFMGILTQGAFRGVESNPLILNAEIGCAVFCVIYLVYVSISSIRSLLNSRT